MAKNLLNYSQNFYNVIWEKSYTTVTENTTLDPNGALSADSIYDMADDQPHFVFQRVTLTPGVTYTFSCYLKDNGFPIPYLAAFDSDWSALYWHNHNLTTPDLTRTTPVGDGWYYCWYSFTPVVGGVCYIYIYTHTGYGAVGDPTKGIIAWGAQVEIGASATAYEKTPLTDTSVSSICLPTSGRLFTGIIQAIKGRGWFGTTASVVTRPDMVTLSATSRTATLAGSSRVVTFTPSIRTVTMEAT